MDRASKNPHTSNHIFINVLYKEWDILVKAKLLNAKVMSGGLFGCHYNERTFMYVLEIIF